ncbi:MAG: hypothetical protein V9E94_20970 [Microthrixaceae bacterium]
MTASNAFPDHLLAISNGSRPVLPGPRTTSLSSAHRYLITSDLHRCIAGRLDWPQRQGVKELYAEVLAGYADDGWHLIENGDVEDFWMVGGSTWGAVYDMAYLTGATVGPRRVEARRTLLGEHLSRIVANNADVYRVLRDGFAADGRYHRTMGNHDDVFADEVMVERLAEHLGDVEVSDTILLRRTDSDDPAERSIDSVDAVVAHGHLTDSWNGHDVAALGQRHHVVGDRARRSAPRRPSERLAGPRSDRTPVEPRCRQPAHRGRSALRRQPTSRQPRRGPTVPTPGRTCTRRWLAVVGPRPHALPDAVAARRR